MDYSIRPAKHVLRKMLSEILKRLSTFEDLESYQYIGFGARELIDFAIFHRTLGISDMTSIEYDRETYERAKTYNLPYGCIKVLYGRSTDLLPDLDHTKRTIYWLDYTETLTATILADTEIISKEATSGSLLIVTANCDFRGEGKLSRFVSFVGDENVPLGTTEDDLREWGAAKVQTTVLKNKIAETLTLRNQAGGDTISPTEVMNIHYKDGARMHTYGVVFCANSETRKLRRCRFQDFEISRRGEFVLNVPALTRRERHILDQCLPTRGELIEQHPWLKSDFEKYRDLYRYYPNFEEVER